MRRGGHCAKLRTGEEGEIERKDFANKNGETDSVGGSVRGSVVGAGLVRVPVVGAGTVRETSITDEHAIKDCTSSMPAQTVQSGATPQEGGGKGVNAGTSVVSSAGSKSSGYATQSSNGDSGAGDAPTTPTASMTTRRWLS